MEIIQISAVVALVALNVFASVRLLKCTSYGKLQKFWQAILVWVLPLIGAIFVLIFMKDDETPKGPFNSEDGMGDSSMGEAG